MGIGKERVDAGAGCCGNFGVTAASVGANDGESVITADAAPPQNTALTSSWLKPLPCQIWPKSVCAVLLKTISTARILGAISLRTCTPPISPWRSFRVFTLAQPANLAGKLHAPNAA